MYLLVVVVVAMTAVGCPGAAGMGKVGGERAVARPRPDRVSELRWSVALLVVAGYAMILLSGLFGRTVRPLARDLPDYRRVHD